MPAHPAWFHRLPEILDVLRHMDTSHLDRQAVEKLFGVGERRARQLIAGLPGIRAGIAAAISRHALIERMEATASSGVYQHLRLHAFGPYIGHEFATLLRSYRVGYSRLFLISVAP